MELELKKEYVTPYLPFSIKVVMEGKKTNVAWVSTKNIAVIRPNGIGEYKKIAWKYAHHNIKLILKPLNNLKSDDIEIVAELICFTRPHLKDYINKSGWQNLPYKYFQILLENHYDVFELIPKGLAVDVNSLSNLTEAKTNITC